MVSLSPHRAADGSLRARPRQILAEAGLLLEHPVTAEHDLTAQQRHPRSPANLPALVRREARDAEMLGALDSPLGRGIPDRDIGVGADTDHALARIEPEDARRVLGHHARKPGDGQPAVDDTFAVHERHERLERRGPEWNGLAFGVDEDVLAPWL